MKGVSPVTHAGAVASCPYVWPLTPRRSLVQFIRTSFRNLGFVETQILQRFGVSECKPLVAPLGDFNPRELKVSPGLDALVHLFIGEQTVPTRRTEQALGARLFHALADVGLLAAESDECFATARIEPVQGLLVCSDRFGSRRFSPDHVLNVWNRSSIPFLRLIPNEPCGTFLELCCGAGAACLLAGRRSRVTLGVDINPRAIRFADFNRILNDVPNVSFECGDLFAPCGSRQFDRIAAHPPYVPLGAAMFDNGGEDGEDLSFTLVAQLPRHLSDRGTFYGYVLLSDRNGSPAERRVRNALGPEQDQFDVALVVDRELPIPATVLRTVHGRRQAAAVRLLQTCRDLGIHRILIGGLIINRTRGRTPETQRIGSRDALS